MAGSSDKHHFRHYERAIKLAPLRLRPRETQHHHGVARGRQQVVAFLHHLAVLAVIEPEFLKSIQQMLENLKAACLHPRQHVHQSGFYRHAAILELRVLMQHV